MVCHATHESALTGREEQPQRGSSHSTLERQVARNFEVDRRDVYFLVALPLNAL